MKISKWHPGKLIILWSWGGLVAGLALTHFPFRIGCGIASTSSVFVRACTGGFFGALRRDLALVDGAGTVLRLVLKLL
jgi:hypothetical protein